MPRVSDVVTSESESERPRSGSTKKTYSAKKARRASSDTEGAEEEVGVDEEAASQPKDSGEDEGEEVEEDDEEYEIEAIIDHKRSGSGGGGFGYLVKWKGYAAEHNSWVDEKDAGNSSELIAEYWRKLGKDKKDPRKSTDGPKKGRRKSTVREESPETSSVSKKLKKPRKSNGATQKKTTTTKKKVEPADEDDDEEIVPIGSMEKHMSIPSWENIVDKIDTIERGEDGQLYVFFRCKKNSDERMRERSSLCAEKFPQKMIKFYESNLRWKLDHETETEAN
ncbi:hypothetical protein BV22DRAFT_1013884 [Leucogyrophana mollusca]|uniref:Uncharacterized protein n=1 Tax=Leucogyrophana mollusca TaxID=85980 RepID=A0ACB8BI01_9AGAM|nr:hypothetical protein BV22DRAFT_1013884 [Leucogyrophana mollusca]